MITCIKADEVKREDLFIAFQIGFADYIIRFDMSQETFFSKFFGSDGNHMGCSYVAYDQGEPIGLLLGGVKEFGGARTMRCGTLCVAPPYRGKGISDELFALHRESAIEKGCKQLFLEVIKGNERAIAFYEKKGYRKVYELKYYTLEKALLPVLVSHQRERFTVKEMSGEEFFREAKKLKEIHFNWQTDLHAMEKIEGIRSLGIYDEEKLVGISAYRASGKIYLIWIDPLYRLRSAGTVLLHSMAEEVSEEKLYMSFSNHMGLRGFVLRCGFTEDALSQYEMVALL